MAASIIRVEFDRLKQIARYFEEESEFVQKLHNQIEADLDMLYRNGWRSPSADKFYAEMYDSVLVSTDNLTKALAQTSLTIRQIMVIMANSDEEATALIKGGGLMIMLEEQGFSIGTIMDLLTTDGDRTLIREWAEYLGYDGVSNYLKYIERFDTYGNSFGLIGEFPLGGWENLALIPGALDIINKHGFTPDALRRLSDYGVSEGFQWVVGLHPIGMGVMAGNSINQYLGGLQSDTSILFRDIITGGDSGLLSHQMMTEGIENFKGIYDDNDLGNIFDGIGRLATDIYVDPIIDEGESLVANIQSGNNTDALKNAGNILNFGRAIMTQGALPASGINPFILDYHARRPENIKEMGYNAIGLGGDTLDFFSGISATYSSTEKLVLDMTAGTNQRIIEVLPLSEGTRETLSSINSNIHHYREIDFYKRNPGAVINRMIDFGDTGREWFENQFDFTPEHQ